MLKNRAGIYLIALLLSACAIQGAPSVEESIAAAAITLETLAESVLSANEAGQLSDENRARAKVVLQQAKNALDLATLMVVNDNDSQALVLLSQSTAYFDTVRRLMEETP